MALSQLELSLIASCPVSRSIKEQLLTQDSLLSDFSKDFCEHFHFPYEKMKSVFSPSFISKTESTLTQQSIMVCSPHSQNYPSSLSQLSPQPLIIFMRGDLSAQPLISVVGSRNITSYGRQVLHSFIPHLVEAGCGVVSGLAFGIDALSHELALSHNGYTAAILPSGIDNATIYPHSHFSLANRILDNGGLLLSPFPLFHTPRKHDFLDRNQLIAAFSSFTLIIEASLRSGSLSTAAHAQKLGKPLGAIPGRITDLQSHGCLSLIADGALPIYTVSQLLTHLSLTGMSTPETSKDPLIQHLQANPVTLEELAILTQFPIPQLLENLTMLELAHKVSLLPDGKYTAVR